MIYPSYGGSEFNNVLENRVDDQDSHIAQMEEENLTLNERLFLMERELGDMRRRLQYLETRSVVGNEEVVEMSLKVRDRDVAARDDSAVNELGCKEQGEKDIKEQPCEMILGPKREAESKAREGNP
ncbi:hypothetical protein Rs2_05402 [Raphanus sativus]|nr:hypothetical protein Rs2_05402 [Raphanus sativus]